MAREDSREREIKNSEFGIRKPPTAAQAIQVSPEGGDHEELAGDGASRRPEGASNSEFYWI